MYKYNKYRNKKVIYSDIKFDSIVEKDRYIYLKAKEEKGLIKGLELQKKFLLQDKFNYKGKVVRAIHYIADFYYIENDIEVVEDVKGIETDAFKLKEKLFKNKYHHIDFYVVKKAGNKWAKK